MLLNDFRSETLFENMIGNLDHNFENKWNLINNKGIFSAFKCRTLLELELFICRNRFFLKIFAIGLSGKYIYIFSLIFLNDTVNS